MEQHETQKGWIHVEGWNKTRILDLAKKILPCQILFYYIKGKTSLFPMEIILLILQELEEFKILVKLAKRKRYEKNRSS